MIDEALAIYNLKNDKYYRLDQLYQIMQDIGLINMTRSSFTSDWMRRKIESKELILPPKMNHAYWRITGRMIKDIVRAFVPSGKGSYDYNQK